LHVIAITHGRLDPETRAYLARKEAEGKSRIEAMRCLKRHLARRYHRLLLEPRNSMTTEVEMAKLIYSAIASLDGYVEDSQGEFGWAAPDDEVFAFVNDLERPIGTYLYGRRMYETMVFWETASTGDGSAVIRDFAEIWRAAEKIVYSRTLQTVSSTRTRIEHEFDPAAIVRLKESAARDITVGGAALAGQAIAARLVDECHLFLTPIVVGGGKRALPDNVHAQLELMAERHFRSGVVHLHYRVCA
jgi:dihydrofolate reductase